MCNLIKFFITVIIIFSTFSSYSKELNLPKNLIRTSKYLEHPVFNLYHSETEMLRYLKKLI